MLSDLFLRFRALIARNAVEREMDEELRFHFDHQVEKYQQAGLSRGEAHRRARMAFGGFDQVKEDYRDALGTRLVDETLRDLRHATRTLASNPIVTIVVIASLALAIGANTAVFTLVDALVLRALPVANPQQLVILADGDGEPRSYSNPLWEEIRSRASSFNGAFAWSPQPLNLARGGEAQFIDGLFASGDFFDVLGISAIVGRTFTAADDRPGGGPDGPVAVISHEFWQRHYGGVMSAIGQPLRLGDAAFTVIGVAPPTFFGPDIGRRFDVALPIGTEPLLRGADSGLRLVGRSWLHVMLRLKPDQRMDVAEAALRGIQPHIRAAVLPEVPEAGRARFLEAPFTLTSATTGTSDLRTRYARPLVTLMTILGAVLLLACLNIANLMLAKADARRHEMSLRTSLGASRTQLARLVLAEVGTVTVIGTMLGVALSQWMSRLLVQQLSTRNSVVFLDVATDWRTVAFASALAMVTTALLGTLAAWQSMRARAGDAVHHRGRGIAGAGGVRSSAALVVGQVALSLVLVVAAGLFVRTFASLAWRHLGFTTDRILVVRVTAPMTAYTLPRLVSVYERIRESVAGLPGVEHAAISDITPVGGGARDSTIDLPGSTLSESERRISVNVISPGWLSTYGTRLIVGRDFSATDRMNTTRVALVNETLAKRFLGEGNPVGRSIGVGLPPQITTLEIVGVVEDAIYRSMRDAVPPTVYTVTTQRPAARPYVHVSVAAMPESSAVTPRAIVAAIAEIDPSLVIQVVPLEEQIDNALTQERVLAMLSGFLGTLALLLAGLGLYGLTTAAVARRRSEIGIRVALGAAAYGVVWLIVRRMGAMVVLGIAIGALLSLWASRFVGSLVWGLEPQDLLTFVGASIVLAAVAAIAAWIPARHAARIDPIAVLREI